jgi:uncharacterized protein DUF5658
VKRLIAIASFSMLLGCSTLASKEAVVGCQAGDAGTTVYAMEHGARELNPIVGTLLSTFGPAGFIAIKAAVTLFLLHVHSTVPMGVMALANGVTCGAAANNTKVILELSKKPKPAAPKPADKPAAEEIGRGGEI